MIGEVRGVTCIDGEETNITLKDVGYVPKLCANLFSLTKAIDKGMSLGNEGKVITLTDGTHKVKFNESIDSPRGFVMEFTMHPTPQIGSMAFAMKGSMNINVLHEWMGHPNFQIVRKTAAIMGINLDGEEETCESCALAKSKQKNVPKVNLHKSEILGERIYVDISYIQSLSMGRSTYWVMEIDEASRFKISKFIPVKKNMSMAVLQIAKEYKSYGKAVKYVRCDNEGENLSIEETLRDNGFDKIHVEHTSPGTPQQNGIVERGFSFLYSIVRSMLNRDGFIVNLRKTL